MNACRSTNLARRHQRRGANAVEFALMLPVLISFLLGIIDFGWYFSQQAIVTNCVREGARTGALTKQDANLLPVPAAEARLTQCLTDGNVGTPNNTPLVALSGAAPDQLVTVTVTVPYTRITGLIPMPPTLNGQVIMRMEDQPTPPPPT